jgi:hypothetical protein
MIRALHRVGRCSLESDIYLIKLKALGVKRKARVWEVRESGSKKYLKVEFPKSTTL